MDAIVTPPWTSSKVGWLDAHGGQAEPQEISLVSCFSVQPTIYFSRSALRHSASASLLESNEFFAPIRLVLSIDREIPTDSGLFIRWRMLDATSSKTGSWRQDEVGRILGSVILPRGRYKVTAMVPNAIPELSEVLGQLELWSSFKAIPSSEQCERAQRGDA